jgi:hypothetical protein
MCVHALTHVTVFGPFKCCRQGKVSTAPSITEEGDTAEGEEVYLKIYDHTAVAANAPLKPARTPRPDREPLLPPENASEA